MVKDSMTVKEMEDLKECKTKFIFMDGYRFTRDERTGYYRCDALRKRIHQYVWEKSNGQVEKGYHIHHINGDKKNNTIGNLECMYGNEHLKLHGESLTIEERQALRDNLNENARPKAVEWHKSPEGLEWHKKHYEDTKHLLYRKDTFICLQCKHNFESVVTGNNKFCSNKCKSKWRRESGVDDVERECQICSTPFVANKYSRKKTCTRSCASKLKYKKVGAS